MSNNCKAFFMYILSGLLLTISPGSALSQPQKMWLQYGFPAGSVYYGGGVYNGTFYTGQMDYGPQQWAPVRTDRNALLHYPECVNAQLARCSVPVGKYIFCTKTTHGLCRMTSWDPTTIVDLKIPDAESVATDAFCLYTTDAKNTNRIHKYAVDLRNGSLKEVWSLDIGASDNKYRGLSYYANHIYIVDQCLDPNSPDNDRGIYEIDTKTGSSKKIAQAPNPGGYQVARCGNCLYLVGLDGNLHVFSFDGSSWKLNNSYDLGLKGLYGIGVKGDVDKTYMWVTSAGCYVSYWNIPKINN